MAALTTDSKNASGCGESSYSEDFTYVLKYFKDDNELSSEPSFVQSHDVTNKQIVIDPNDDQVGVYIIKVNQDITQVE